MIKAVLILWYVSWNPSLFRHSMNYVEYKFHGYLQLDQSNPMLRMLSMESIDRFHHHIQLHNRNENFHPSWSKYWKNDQLKKRELKNQQEHPYLSFSQGLLVHSSFSQVFPEYPVGHAQSKSGSPVNAFIFLEQTPFVVFDNSWVINDESFS